MIQLNTQPVEKPDYREDGALEVFHIWATIQGEGPHAGRPAVFLRLSGCNLMCPACDTDYTSRRRLQAPEDLRGEISSLARRPGTDFDLVVITGGEPFRQDLAPLVKLLLPRFDVQIETNGTLYLPGLPYGDPGLSIVCSPKTGAVSKKLQPHIMALKYILEAGKVDPEDGLPLDSLGAGVRVARPWPGVEVFVQPLDDQDGAKNQLHTAAAVDSCMRFGYRLSFQIHKLLGLE